MIGYGALSMLSSSQYWYIHTHTHTHTQKKKKRPLSLFVNLGTDFDIAAMLWVVLIWW
jgi:hypothetical protein